ncbi:hypothetical protein Y032_0567g39 [Ancylostoma ceylanicum]|uniref:Uncharacterized protein n=1 Tax=Ancylostoma ceylanicum TaxID=53326 RepID=A0A016WPI4_9BILA|nr:hypothetical protein Y032_0567g39 [Ancylostoma ceylanicum]
MPHTGRDHYIPIKADKESVDDEDDDDVGLIACRRYYRGLTSRTKHPYRSVGSAPLRIAQQRPGSSTAYV